MFPVLTFALCSAGFVAVSRKSLQRPRSHGFARFFAFEAILALFLLNYPHWVDAPFSPAQIFSWLLLLVSIYLVGHGSYLLRAFGKPDPLRHDDTLLDFEKTSRLVTVGVYKYIRHPLYASLLFFAWGAFLKHMSGVALLLVLAASWLLHLTAKKDEVESAQYFGDAYRRYLVTTKRFIPFVW